MSDLFGLVGTRLDGKYDVHDVVAEGGFGVVYRATHCTLEKPVAVKVLKAPEHLQGAARVAFLEGFAREARTIARLEHPAVVRVIDFGASTLASGVAAPWMVLEWLTGATLEEQLLARRGAGGRTPAECMAMLRPAFEALAAAHEMGIAHRDIKPANVMVSARPGTGRSTSPRRGEPLVRVMDFGIAKVMAPDETSASGQTRTQAALVAFSLPYAAPEQVSGTRTGPWTDVHALALVASEMLTDAAPYRGNEAMELHMEVLSPWRPTPAKYGVDVGAWEPVLARALALRPAERFASAGELLAALEATLDGAMHRPLGRPSQAHGLGPRRPMTTLQPAARASSPPAPSGRGRAAALALGMLVALAGVTAQGWWLLRAPDAAPDAAPVPAARPAPPPTPTPIPAAQPRPAPAPVAAPAIVPAPVVAPPAPVAQPRPHAEPPRQAASTRARAVRGRRARGADVAFPSPLMPVVAGPAPAEPVGRIPAE